MSRHAFYGFRDIAEFGGAVGSALRYLRLPRSVEVIAVGLATVVGLVDVPRRVVPVGLCWALLIEKTQLPRFDSYRQPATGARDLLVRFGDVGERPPRGHFRRFLLEQLNTFLATDWRENTRDSETLALSASPTDLEARYKFNDVFSLAVGGDNVFNTHPDKEKNPVLQFLGNQYALTSPFGFNGAFWYLRFKGSF